MLEKFFQLKANNTRIQTEVLAGITTFIAGMYIIIVNPAILVDAGIPYSASLTATVVLSALTTIGMGLYAKNPILMAPGMGINAYFTYTVVQVMGVDPHIALGAIFWSGIVFILLSVFNIRTHIIQAIPKTIRIAGAVGIGLFIALIGLVNSGFIVAKAPLTGVGEINAMTATFLLGLLISIVLLVKKSKGAFIIGIVITTLLAWPIGRWYGDASAVNHGLKTLINWDGFYAAPDFSWFFKMEILKALKYTYIPVIFTLLFVDMFDSITTFVGVAEAGNLKDNNGDPRNIKQSMIVDGFATFLGSIFGTSPGTAYIESAAGIHEGGRTGLTAVVAGLLFLPFMFFSPLAELVPSIATAPVLVLVGVFMAGPLNKIQWQNLEEAIPAFLTIVLIPLTYSLTQGLVYGLLSYTLIKLVRGKANEIPVGLYFIDISALLMLGVEYGII
ncbi:MAG: NCS2 family permease [Bacteroidales bacterium]|nr:NCS2 family permease [Bacteroidales bacterium]